MPDKRRGPAEGRGSASATYYGLDVRLDVRGCRRIEKDGPWTVLLRPVDALKLAEDLARSVGAILVMPDGE